MNTSFQLLVPFLLLGIVSAFQSDITTASTGVEGQQKIRESRDVASVASGNGVGQAGGVKRRARQRNLAGANMQNGTAQVDPKVKAAKLAKYAKGCERAHEEFRKWHNATNLVPDQTLREKAERRLKQIKHDGSGPLELPELSEKYGENVIGVENFPKNCSYLVNAWYIERESYNYSKPGYAIYTGHFTQLVWRSTLNIGCAVVSEPEFKQKYLGCLYTPSGNLDDAYEENVLPRQ